MVQALVQNAPARSMTKNRVNQTDSKAPYVILHPLADNDTLDQEWRTNQVKALVLPGYAEQKRQGLSEPLNHFPPDKRIEVQGQSLYIMQMPN